MQLKSVELIQLPGSGLEMMKSTFCTIYNPVKRKRKHSRGTYSLS